MTLLRLTPALATHRGMRRRHNEDAIGYEYPTNKDLLLSHGALFVVADGVGGLAAGDKASQMTVEQLIKRYYESDASLRVEQRLAEAIQAVNSSVFSTLKRKGATTLVAVVIIEEQLVAASAGDSQIFRIVGDNITQLNEEDVLHSDDADDGALTKAVGYREEIEIETISGTLQVNDKILLCSDGLTRYLDENQLTQLAQLRDPRDSVRRMINQANTAGGADNISAVLVHVGESIELSELAAHLKRIQVRVAVDTDPMMMQDVPSKPTTQIPMSRPVPALDESLLSTPELPKRVEEKASSVPVSAPVPQASKPSQSNGMMVIIIAAVAILAVGAVIFGIALASLGDDSASNSPSEITEDEMNTDSNIDLPESSEDNLVNDASIEIGDYILLDEVILTKNGVGADVASFLTSSDTPYLINNITEDSEGQLWYLLLEEDTGQTGWLVESDLPAYTIQRD